MAGMYWCKAEKIYYIKLSQYFVVLHRQYIIAEHLGESIHIAPGCVNAPMLLSQKL